MRSDVTAAKWINHRLYLTSLWSRDPLCNAAGWWVTCSYLIVKLFSFTSSWRLWGCEPWNSSFKDSDYDDEQEEETCSPTHGEAEKFLSEGEETKNQSCSFWPFNSWMNELIHGWISGWMMCVRNGSCGWSVTSHSNHSSSHTGGLVSPTDRPTISAMTASRINRANARIMYFCRVKERLLRRF